MFPLGDNNSDRTTTPFVNYVLIALNILAFLLWQKMGNDESIIARFATVPQEIVKGSDISNGVLGPTPIPVYLTLITSMFMHGGWAHIGGNMLYLWIFGDNLENRMGHSRYLLFYLLCGILAGLSHVYATYFLGKDMFIPSLGASGAISGVLGGYILLFPKNEVRVLMMRSIIQVPALVAVGIWFLFQIISGLGMLGGTETGGGVAYAAHIGGFIAGLLLVNFFAKKITK
jgi:membrane associated rhomboid family serine protease